MNKLFSILITISLILCMSGCDAENPTPNIENSSDKDIKFWIDNETGVQYIIYTNHNSTYGMGGITPRLNSDGTLYIKNSISK
jgi:hypothetical protein